MFDNKKAKNKRWWSFKKGSWLRIGIPVLIILALALLVWSDQLKVFIGADIIGGPNPTLAPTNPEFEKFIARPSDGLMQTESSDQPCDNCKLVPESLDLSHLNTANPAIQLEGDNLLKAAYPTSYDLRQTAKLSPIRNQGLCGSCWTFGTFASAESYLRPNEIYDFSENNLNNLHGFDVPPCQGGNRTIATAYNTRWSGPIDEKDDPYTLQASPTNLSPVRHVQDVLYVPNRTNPNDNDNFKEMVMNYGALYAVYYHSNSYLKSSTAGYYYTGSYSPNHAVAVVGWDDNYAASNFLTPPPGPGAFIVRNSWGTSWGDNGYFYVSYYDTKFGYVENAVTKSSPTNDYAQVYQYDPYGWISATGYGSNTAYMANVFTASTNNPIDAAGIYVASPGSTYELSVYKDPTNGPLNSNGPSYTKSGTVDAGYHTIVFDNSVPVSTGQKFSIVLKINTPGYSYPLPLERPYAGYSSKATANLGESYMSPNGTSWTDVASYFSQTNIALKAYAGKEAPVGALTVSPETLQPFKGQVKSAFTPAVQTLTLKNNSTQPLSWNATKTQEWLNINPIFGTIAANSTASVEVSLKTFLFTTGGTYNDSITLQNANDVSNTLTRLVTVNVENEVDTTPPSQVTWSNEIYSTKDSVRLGWNPATDNVGIKSYRLVRNGTEIANNITDTSYLDTGLTPDTGYTYTINAIDTSGNQGPASVPIGIKTAPIPPSDTSAPSIPNGLVATSTTSSVISFKWNASTDNVAVTGYNIYRDGTKINTATATSYTDSGLAPSRTYSYTVSAYDAAGNTSGKSGVLSAKTTGAAYTSGYLSGKLYDPVAKKTINAGTLKLVNPTTGATIKTVNVSSGTFYNISIQPGEYLIRAYANYYLNYEERFVYAGDVQTVNKQIDMVQGVELKGSIYGTNNTLIGYANVNLLKDGKVVATTKTPYSGLSKGTYSFKQDIAFNANYQIRVSYGSYTTQTVPVSTTNVLKDSYGRSYVKTDITLTRSTYLRMFMASISNSYSSFLNLFR